MQTQSCMQHSARINYNSTTCSAGHSYAHSSDFILFLYYIYNIISTLCQIKTHSSASPLREGLGIRQVTDKRIQCLSCEPPVNERRASCMCVICIHLTTEVRKVTSERRENM